MYNFVTEDNYKGTVLEKSFSKKQPSFEEMEITLKSNFDKGLITEEDLQKSLKTIELLKGGKKQVESEEEESEEGEELDEEEEEKSEIEKALHSFIEKAFHGGNGLVLTHIINKKGNHQVVWKKPGTPHQDEKEHLREVIPGDKINYKGEEHTIHNIKHDGYLQLKDKNGKRHDKSPLKVDFHKPEGVKEQSKGEVQVKGHYEKIKDQLLEAGRGSVVSGGGYSYTCKGEGHWVNKKGESRSAKAIADELGGFSDFKIKDEDGKVMKPKKDEKSEEYETNEKMIK
jgi:hypothetical protein